MEGSKCDNCHGREAGRRRPGPAEFYTSPEDVSNRSYRRLTFNANVVAFRDAMYQHDDQDCFWNWFIQHQVALFDSIPIGKPNGKNCLNDWQPKFEKFTRISRLSLARKAQ